MSAKWILVPGKQVVKLVNIMHSTGQRLGRVRVLHILVLALWTMVSEFEIFRTLTERTSQFGAIAIALPALIRPL